MKALGVLVWLVPSLCWAAASRNFNNTTADYIDLGNDANLVPGFTWSVLAIVRTSQTDAAFRQIITMGRRTVSGFYLGKNNSGGQLVFVKYGLPGIAGTNTTAMSVNTWHAVGAVVTSTNVRFLNVNLQTGAFNGENVADSNAFDNTPTPTEAELGLGRSGTGVRESPWAGDIFAVEVCQTSISDGEFQSFAYAPSMQFGSPKGTWFLWGDTPEVDVSGNNTTGTVNGTTTTSNGPPVFFGGIP